MGVVRNIIVRAGGDFSGLTAATAKATAGMKKMQSGFNLSTTSMRQNVGGLISTFGKLAIAVYAARQVYNFGKACIEASSNLTEVQNVVDVTFGASAQKIEAFSKSASKSFGLTEYAAKHYSSALGAMLKSSGFGEGAAADMSVELTKITADLASFYNMDYDESYEKVASGMAGMVKPLRSLGISLTVANLEAYAMEQGIKKAYSAMTQAEQMTLRYNYILKATADAQGDFSRTSGTWANQIRLVGENFSALKTNIGSVLTYAVLPLVKGLNYLLEVAVAVSGALARLFSGLFGKITLGSKGVVQEAEEAAEDAEDVGGGGGGGGKDKKLYDFDQLQILKTGKGGGGGGAAEEAAEDAAKNESILDRVSAKMDAFAQKAKAWFEPVRAAWEQFGDAVKGLWDRIVSVFAAGVNALGITFDSTLMGDRWQGLLTGLAQVLEGVVKFISGTVDMIAGLLGNDLGLALQGANSILESFAAMFHGVLEALFGHAAVEAFDDWLLYSAEQLSLWWQTKVKPWFTAERWQQLWAEVKKAFMEGWNQIKSWWSGTAIGQWFENDVKPWFTAARWAEALGGIKEGFKAAFRDAANAAIAVLNSMIGWVNSKASFSWKGLSIKGTEIIPGGSMTLFQLPTIPALATGGIVGGSTLAQIGENGAEAVLPLENNTGWMDELAKRLAVEVNVNAVFSGQLAPLARVLQPYFEVEKQRRGASATQKGFA